MHAERKVEYFIFISPPFGLRAFFLPPFSPVRTIDGNVYDRKALKVAPCAIIKILNVIATNPLPHQIGLGRLVSVGEFFIDIKLMAHRSASTRIKAFKMPSALHHKLRELFNEWPRRVMRCEISLPTCVNIKHCCPCMHQQHWKYRFRHHLFFISHSRESE